MDRKKETNKKARDQNKWNIKGLMRKNAETRRSNGKHLEWSHTESGKNSIKKANLKRQYKNHNINIIEWKNCKKYFDYECAYCGLHIDKHYVIRKGIPRIEDFQKEHFINNGANNLSNCIPSCKNCNSQKWKFEFDKWYSDKNVNYTEDRCNKILKWINDDYKKYIGIKENVI